MLLHGCVAVTFTAASTASHYTTTHPALQRRVRRSAAKLLIKDGARRIAANNAKLPDLLRLHPTPVSASPSSANSPSGPPVATTVPVSVGWSAWIIAGKIMGRQIVEWPVGRHGIVAVAGVPRLSDGKRSSAY